MEHILILTLLWFKISQQKILLVETEHPRGRENSNREYRDRDRGGDYQYISPGDEVEV